jgi:solute carrier family 10 (sodium/bile acid cotransporter), member 7
LRDYKAVVFMGSQKTLPIALAVIAFLPESIFGLHGLLTIPCIIGHLSQLFIDAFIASRMAAAEEDRQEKRKADAANEQVLSKVL